MAKRTGDDKIDIVIRDRAQDSIGRISLAIMNRQIARQLQAPKYLLEPFCRLIGALPDVNQIQA